jgi:hypothetical protein
MGVPGRFGRKAEDRTNSRIQESESRSQNPEVRSQKKRKSVDAVLSLFILDSEF